MTNPPIPVSNPLEFHLSRLARERYDFERDLVDWESPLPRPDTAAVHDLAFRMNTRLGPRWRSAKPGNIFALVLIQQVLHRVIELYRRQLEPDLYARAESWLAQRFSAEGAEQTLHHFAGHYPPLPVYRGHELLPQYLNRPVDGRAGKHERLEQMLLVYIANSNPAASDIRDLYDDRELLPRENYLAHIAALEQFFALLTPFGPKRQSLFDMLREPAKASPDSLLGQLEFMRREWGDLLGPELLRLLLTAEDLVREDERGPFRVTFGQGPDADYLQALASRSLFARDPAEPERFTIDKDWMPRAVLMAKSVYVWLDQLSKQYGRTLRRLDEIPDEELDRLAGWGFSGLWLIGLWERSPASRMIKHLRGNPDAVASAYSILDYRISENLGGDAALDNLRARALARGIRLASDLVPNHMGIDSAWTREHPDWFIQIDQPPYGAYHYTGPDVSSEPSISLRIEDGYWNQTDAAVVFQRVDHTYGNTRYIYHGNDGTSMPWNDTAQLNFLIPEVREAVIRLILEVAKRFPILRFDAAMTLTKKHYQRLWFPEPGTGGAIPSRALFGLTRDEFDRAMPEEFWRQVVDRVAEEAPETLLIAEAFWLLEGFFVRTLGMHRVYNSAFMNLLKLEENAKYRTVIKNILEFDPRILQRFVNFMNNPDEDTAVAQFGKGDKYFGVAMMMATMPGLPMFGHGQIEGLTERYGHEYQRAYYDERPDEELVRRHEREIFPVLRQRHLFSGADRFLLYDVAHDDGGIDENVFAFSNGSEGGRALVVFHNRYAETSGTLRLAAPMSVPNDTGGRHTVQRTLAQGLELRDDPGVFYVLRDRIANLEYLRRGADLARQGLHVHLRAYQCQVFTEFREIRDDAEGRWSRLAEILGGRGVPSLEREFKRVYLAPLIAQYAAFAKAEHLRALVEVPAAARGVPLTTRTRVFAEHSRPFIAQALHFGSGTRLESEVAAELETMAATILSLPAPSKYTAFGRARPEREARAQLVRVLPERRSLALPFWRVLTGWLTVWPTGRLIEEDGANTRSARFLDDWLLCETLQATFRELGASDSEAWREVELVRVLLMHSGIARTFSARRRFAGMAAMLQDEAVQRLVGAHTHGGIVWFHRESWEDLARWLFVITLLDVSADTTLTRRERALQLTSAQAHFQQIDDLCLISDYQIDRFQALLGYAAGPESPAIAKRPSVKRKAATKK